MKVATIGLDIAKHIFQVHGADAEGRPVLRRQLRRSQVARFFANLPPCVVGMEACCGAHYWSRVIGRFGHTVRLIAPQFVKPYVKSNKNDANECQSHLWSREPSARALRAREVGRLRRGLPLTLEDATNELTAFSRRLFASLYDELLSLEGNIEAIGEQIWAVYQASEPCQRIAAVEGIGPLNRHRHQQVW